MSRPGSLKLRTNSTLVDGILAAGGPKDLRSNYGIFCSGVIYPVVPKGVIMLRIIPTASHKLEDVDLTISAFKEVKKQLDSGIYKKMGQKGSILS